MLRNKGKIITHLPWIAIKFSSPAKAEEWRRKSRPFFSLSRKESKPKVIAKMTSAWPKLVDDSLDKNGEDVADRIFKGIQTTVLSDKQSFHSHSFELEEEDDILLDQMVPPECKTERIEKPQLSLADLRKEMIKGTGKSVSEEAVKLAWQKNKLFTEIVPGGGEKPFTPY